jgi:hypothetical protein
MSTFKLAIDLGGMFDEHVCDTAQIFYMLHKSRKKTWIGPGILITSYVM